MPEQVTDPTPAPEAFNQTDDAAAQSQAALLLLLGRQVRGDDTTARASLVAAGGNELAENIPAEDLSRFPVPEISHSGERISPEKAAAGAGDAFLRARISDTEQLESPEFWYRLAERLYREPTALAAAVLMEACLRHPQELTRVAAASSYFDLSAEPIRILDVLVRGTYSFDELVRDVAATALARAAPEHPRLAQLTRPAPFSPVGDASHTALLVHGTYARNASWWQPLGDFHLYLSTLRPDLYGAGDHYSWSGGYSDAARALAAVDLQNWVNAHTLSGLDLFAHSHGGSACMLASQAGMQIGKLVLLSCPVHFPRYVPRFENIQEVVSIRVRLDLVILADGGGQRFRHPQIRENVIPVWFNHSATHDRQTWQRHNIAAML